jgi:hypothetical protein
VPADHRIVVPGQGPQPFTCRNFGYKTNTGKGESHGVPSNAHGSVFPNALATSPGWTLWLEHVLEEATGAEMYWLMWYDSKGFPPIPASAVFGKDELRQMLSRLPDLIP